MLSETTIQIPLVKGIDTKTDSKVAPIGDLVTLENGVFTTPGKIRKRNGGENILTGVTTPTKAVMPYGDTLVVVDGNNHLQMKVGSALVDKGAIPSITARPTAIARNTSQSQTSPDGAYHINTGREMFVWEEDNQIRYRVIDASTNVQLADGTVGTGLCKAPRVMEFGTGFVISWYRWNTYNSYGDIRYTTFNATTLTFGAIEQLTSNIPPLSYLAAQRCAYDVRKDGTDLVFSYPYYNSPNIYAGATVLHSNMTVSNYAAIGMTTTDLKCITARVVSNKLIWFWQDEADQIRLTEFDISTSTLSDKGVQATIANVHSITASSLVFLAPGSVVGHRYLVLLSQRPQDPVDSKILSLTIQEVSGTYSLPYSTPQTVVTGLSMASGVSNPVSGKYTFVAANRSNEQGTYFLYEYNDEVILDGSKSIVARILSGVAGGPPAYSSLPQVYTRLSDYGFACLEKTALGPSPKAGLFALTSVDRVVIGQGATVKSVPAANGLLIALGDLLMNWDGSSLTEHSFHLYPDTVKLPAITTSGKSWQYCACYSYMDHHGQVHRSAASTPVTYTSSSAIDDTHTVSIQVPGLSATTKQGVQVELYRTKDAGTTFYRLATLPNGAGWLSYVDSNTDSVVEGITQILAPSGLTATVSTSALTSPGFNYQSKRLGGGSLLDTVDYWYLLTVCNEFGETLGQTNAYKVPGTNSDGYLCAMDSISNGVITLSNEVEREKFTVGTQIRCSDKNPADPVPPQGDGTGIGYVIAKGTGNDYTVTVSDTANGQPTTPFGWSIAKPHLRLVDPYFSHLLGWSPVTGAKKYKIYMAATAIGGLEPDDSAFWLVEEVPGDKITVTVRDPEWFSLWHVVIPPPTTNTTSAGSLSAGNKYYRVSAINENGETEPCPEVVVNNTTSAVDLSWTRVPNCTGYRVYGRSTGAELFMAELRGVDSTTWHDDGSITPSGAIPGSNTTGTARSTAIGNITLYTSGGVVDNMPPPPVAWLATGKGRVFVADAENQNRVCFSHEILHGQPVEFSPVYLSVQVDPTGGAIAAVQAMDEKLLCFKASSIYAFAGQGPDRTGSNSDYQPQIIAGDCGCSSPGSCVLMPAGVMFQSSKGIMLLDRALGLGYIGAPVEAYNSESVNSGVLVATANHVRMATSSRVLVYDYHMGAWATFALAGIKSSCVYGGKWTYGLATSVVQENSGFTDPGGAAISMKIKTAWINFAGAAGFARARRLALLGSYLSAHLLRVKLYVTPSDNSAVAVQDETFTANSGELHRIPMTQQKFSALQVEIWDDFTGLSPGEGYDISALAFEVGMKPKIAKLSSSKTY